MHFNILVLKSEKPVEKDWIRKNWDKAEDLANASFILGEGNWEEFDVDQMLRNASHTAVDNAMHRMAIDKKMVELSNRLKTKEDVDAELKRMIQLDTD